MLCSQCTFTVTNEIHVPPPPVPRLLGTNFVPDELELTYIYHVLAKVQSDILLVDSEIAQVEELWGYLCAKRSALEDFDAEQRPFTSAFRRFPPELLSEIFLCCCSSADGIRPYQSGSSTSPQGIIAEVCKYWRDVALSTPLLWTNLPAFTAQSCSQSAFFLTQNWIARSGPYPLSVTFDVPDSFPEAAANIPLMQMLNSVSERWQKLNIRLPFRLLKALTQIRGRLTSLTTLEIRGNATWDHIWTGPLNVFEIAPNLQSILLDFAVHIRKLLIPWSNIAECEAHRDAANDAVEILQKANNLRTYILLLCKPSNSILLPNEHTVSKSVRSFSLRVFPCQYTRREIVISMASILDFIAMPALSELYIDVDVQGAWAQGSPSRTTPWAQSSLLSFWARSGCSLTVLKLNGGPDADQLVECLWSTPMLICLQVSTNPRCINEKLLNQLTLSENVQGTGVGIMVPALQHLALECVFKSLAAMVKMVESRWNFPLNGTGGLAHDTCTRLASIQLLQSSTDSEIEWDRDTEEMIEQLRLFRDKGLTVILNSKYNERII